MNENGAALKERIRSWAGDVVEDALPILADAVRPDAPIGTMTPTSTRPPGQLRDAIQPDPAGVERVGDRAVGHLIVPVIQALTTDRGAVPHVIVVRRARALRFWWDNGPSGPGIYNYLRVNHPGNPPQGWWEPALRRHWAEALRRASHVVSF